MTRQDDLNGLDALPTDALYGVLKERGNLPAHVAIIMDGNGRWARKRHLPRVAGHRAGRHAVRACVSAAGRLGVEVLTLFTFSQENFNRPQAEVKALWSFLDETLAAEQSDLDRRGVRLVATGDLEQLPAQVRGRLDEAVAALSGNDGLVLNLALAYGGRQEILHAALELCRRLQDGELDRSQVDEAAFARGMYSPDLPDPDLLIRTSGEMRLSNFLLWQCAYAELLISPILWPDFREREFLLAVADYQGRERRFGALPAAEEAAPADSGSALWDISRWKRLMRGRP